MERQKAQKPTKAEILRQTRDEEVQYRAMDAWKYDHKYSINPKDLPKKSYLTKKDKEAINRAAEEVQTFLYGDLVEIDTSQLRPYLIEFLCSKCGRREYRQFVITDDALKAARDIRVSAREFADLVVKEYRSDIPQTHINPIASHKSPNQVSGYEICLGPVCPVMVWSHAIADPKEGNQLPTSLIVTEEQKSVAERILAAQYGGLKRP